MGKHHMKEKKSSVYQQVWSFRHPVSGVSGTIVFASQDDEGNSFFLIAFSCLKDVNLRKQQV